MREPFEEPNERVVAPFHGSALSRHKHALLHAGTGPVARTFSIQARTGEEAMRNTMTDLRGYTVREPEGATTGTKLLAAAVVLLGVAAIGAYAYTSHSLLPSTPQKVATYKPIPLTPPAQPATPPPQSAPQTQSTAPEINAPAPHAAVKAKSSERIANPVRTPAAQPETAPATTPPDTARVPATPSQTNVAPTAPATTPQNTETPQSTAPADTQQPQQPTPDQTTPQTQSPQ
jgi:hypothetical protein